MPTYVYRRADGTTFEAFQRISDEPLREDPETGEPVERVISGGAGLQFKGSGFYLTDYARKGSNGDASDSTPAAKDAAPASASGDSSGTTKTAETKADSMG